MALARKVQQRIRKYAKEGRCLGCDRQPKKLIRGLCVTCRNAASYAVKSNRTTEDELIRRGLLLPSSQPGRPLGGDFNKRLQEAEAGK